MSTERIVPRCRERVSYNGGRWHLCTKKVFKDSLCKFHQPEAVKARDDKFRDRFYADKQARCAQEAAAARLAEFHARHFDKLETALHRLFKTSDEGRFEGEALHEIAAAHSEVQHLFAAIAADRSNLK